MVFSLMIWLLILFLPGKVTNVPKSPTLIQSPLEAPKEGEKEMTPPAPSQSMTLNHDIPPSSPPSSSQLSSVTGGSWWTLGESMPPWFLHRLLTKERSCEEHEVK